MTTIRTGEATVARDTCTLALTRRPRSRLMALKTMGIVKVGTPSRVLQPLSNAGVGL